MDHALYSVDFFFNTSGSILFLQSDVLIIRSMSFPSQILSGSVTHSSFGSTAKKKTVIMCVLQNKCKITPMYDMLICASFINVSFFYKFVFGE